MTVACSLYRPSVQSTRPTHNMFLHKSNEQSKKQIRKAIPFIQQLKELKYLEIHLIRDERLKTKGYKVLLKFEKT